MSTVPASASFKDMIVEMDKDEFDSFAFLNLTQESAVDNLFESVSMRDATEVSEETCESKGLL
jgi:hypothetical protein